MGKKLNKFSLSSEYLSPSKAWKDYEVRVTGIGRGVCELTYQLGTEFFALFETSLIEEGKLAVKVKVQPSYSVISMILEIHGTVELTCDRSLEVFSHPVTVREELLFKFGTASEWIGDNLYGINEQTTTVNIAQHLYDFVSLDIPFKKLHPKFVEEEGLLFTVG